MKAEKENMNDIEFLIKINPLLVHGLSSLLLAARDEKAAVCRLSVPMSEVVINGVNFQVQLSIESNEDNFLKLESITIYD